MAPAPKQNNFMQGNNTVQKNQQRAMMHNQLGFQQQLNIHQRPEPAMDRNNFSFSPDLAMGANLPNNLFQNPIS